MDSENYLHKPYAHLLITLVLVGMLLALGAYARLTFLATEVVPIGDATVSVSGTGEVLAKPDIGTFSFAVRAEGETATEAQEASAESINAILAYLTGAGVDEKDIKTQYYNLNPRYRYEERICAEGVSYCPPGEPIVDGYEVSQNVTVKVRDLENSGNLISAVGERGATNISSLNFTIDDETVLQAEAREKAIIDAREKAFALAEDLGMRVVRIVGFYENEGGYYPAAYNTRGFGGDMMEEAVMDMKISPALPTGENTVTSNVTLTVELR